MEWIPLKWINSCNDIIEIGIPEKDGCNFVAIYDGKVKYNKFKRIIPTSCLDESVLTVDLIMKKFQEVK